ncbi:MAG: hypothetical protein QOJ65_981 [Fimbriimonadaceae bacterium]|nr:hypothetical protein [Fimbriimonadaceae bacterium]
MSLGEAFTALGYVVGALVFWWAAQERRLATWRGKDSAPQAWDRPSPCRGRKAGIASLRGMESSPWQAMLLRACAEEFDLAHGPAEAVLNLEFPAERAA